jgi:hypothetical protein
LFLALVAGCTQKTDEGSVTLAEVGCSQITVTDLVYKVSIEKAYGNDSVTDADALVLLINDRIEDEVAKSVGVNATKEEITDLSNHADNTTKAPLILASVKRAFGEDIDSYHRIYLSPKINNGKLRNWFSSNNEIHKEQREKIKGAFSLIKKGDEFKNVADKSGLTYIKTEFDKRNYEISLPPINNMPEKESAINSFVNDPIPGILKSLSDGELNNYIIEDEFGYKIIRLVNDKESAFESEIIFCKKLPYSKWYKEQAATLNIRVTDQKLLKEIALMYPTLFWINKG